VRTRSKVLIASGLAVTLVAAGVTTYLVAHRNIRHAKACAGPRSPEPVAGHPRLLVKSSDLDRLRGFATPQNPVYANGIAAQAAAGKRMMDAGEVPGSDSRSDTYDEYPTESYAELFAFLSLVVPDRAARDDYGRRACSLVMDVLRDDDLPEPFSTSDRSRWSGEAFALTVDWAYPYFSGAEKAAVRTTFLRWADEQVHAHTTDYNHPEPIGVRNDPALLADRTAVRWSLNNYYTAHARNLGLMAMALDDGDDPGGTLHHYLETATGSFLYVCDHALRTDAEGGMTPEGFEYGPQAAGYVAQLELALHTAGMDDPARFGPQVVFGNNPFWSSFVPAILHSLPPQPVVLDDDQGPVYLPAWYGDGLDYYSPDMIESVAPLALYAAERGDRAAVDAIRWLEINAAPGGAEHIADRIDDSGEVFKAILYFLLLDPAAPAPADPRPALPLTHFAPGAGRLLARTGWGPHDGILTYSLGWKGVDHQRADGNSFEWYSGGEWLTKQQVAYSGHSTDYTNGVSIRNDDPEHNQPDDYRHQLAESGSQWTVDTAGDPRITAMSTGGKVVAVTGDATNLYNNPYEKSTGVARATRSLVWLEPDTIVVYDRAETNADGRFKRFWLQLPAEPHVDGHRTTMRSPKGQQFTVDTLLPAGATVTSEPAPHSDDIANGDPIRFRLRVEDPAQPKRVDFLNVLRTGPQQTVRPVDDGGPCVGAAVGSTVVLFPRDIDTPASECAAGAGPGSRTYAGGALVVTR